MASEGPVQVVFFDVRDTLGEVDRPGHLVPYRPSTEKLLSSMRDEVGLRIGLISNLPKEVDAAAGRRMIQEAVLSQSNGTKVTIGDFIDPDGIVINHDAGVDKPNPEIYRFAARQMGVEPAQCMFVGENLIEVLAAKAAGMQGELKPCPPGREFLPAEIKGMKGTPTDSGRAFEAFFEHEHLLGDRIFDCMDEISKQLQGLKEGDAIPRNVYGAMGILIYLTNNFADQAHLQAEEAVVPLAIARGMDPDSATWLWQQHDQGRAYFRALDIAWKRVQFGDPADVSLAIDAFWRNCEGFVKLFRAHAIRENDELYPTMGRYFNDTDDTLVINLISHIGPGDFTPYVGLVSSMEEALGLTPGD
jgi:hemerythrin-like domain-containing protein